jgi:sigma-B regulation protein RsbU (phosphoserine phosphatase)
MAVAWQMALAIENAQLVHQRAEEERLAHELKFAAEVQRRLFPQCPPTVAALDLCGVCHPARGVGGDYYDFLALGNGLLGIAVADVSGKGMSAALLMSVVQASLRVQATTAAGVNGQLTELVASMNRLLYQSTDASHYATFFYALFDERARRLSYVNAGHNPPMLFRRGRRVSAHTVGEGSSGAASPEPGLVREPFYPLARGGPVIGLLEDCAYEHEMIELQPGDVPVAYTDGVSEAQNPEGDEFGEARLAEVIAAHAHLSAEELRDRIVAGLRAWVCDAPQYDDLTLVVMKVK